MSRKPLTVLLAAALLAAPSAGGALAQDGGGAVAHLSLEEARRMALENNLGLVAAMRDPAIAEQQIEISEAPFDGALDAGATYSHGEEDEVITADGIAFPPTESESDNLSAFARFSQLLKFGGTVSLRYDYNDLEASGTDVQQSTGFITDSTFLRTQSGPTLDYRMPLLAGFGKEVNTEPIVLARGNLDISMADLRLRAIETLQSVENAYWDLLAFREGLRISRIALERAEDLRELNRKKVEVGTLAPIEITEAEAGVASQVEAVIVAENSLENAEDRLLELLAVPEDSRLWDTPIEPTDRPSFVPVDVDLDAAIEQALRSRPEMEAAEQRLENARLSERVARRRVNHELELVSSVSPEGVLDTEQVFQFVSPPSPPGTTATDSDALDWSVGLNWRYPLGNRQAKAEYRIAELQTEKGWLSLHETEQAVRVSVRVAARNLRSDVQRVEAARQNVLLQQEKLEAEEKKFDNGMSTSFEVLTFQNDLADAELAEIQARLDYLRSLTELERAKGTLLESRGLALAPSTEPFPPLPPPS